MKLSTISLLILGLLTWTTLAGSQGRGNNPNNPPSATCNTVPTKRRLESRDASLLEGFQLERTPPPPLADNLDQLLKRSGSFEIDKSCDAPLPTGSKWGSGFPTMASIVKQAFADAMTLADRMQSISQNHPA